MDLFKQLKELFGEDIAKKIVDTLQTKTDTELIIDNKKEPQYIKKSDYDKAVSERDNYKNNFDTLDKSLKSFKKTLGAEKLEDIKSKFETLEKDLNNSKQTIKDQEFNFNLEKVILGSKPKDIADILPHIKKDSLAHKNGEFIGLDEQIKNLKENKAYLFEEDNTPGNLGGPGNPARGNTGLDNTTQDNFDEVILNSRIR
ncbi:MAG: phage scaffolding protein [Tepidibacter sp.]|jgi:hypothetical protein|uniref:phage scaffolding protein n=1 Tax=Tepidibacter sp. TaxID=2529387 RepID=UPI0025F9C3DB|nr:phage scaffolding protein [Tepidibacter sp.]MCT4507933.1 phage scaffolding protein [Tepidibacter sp.]